MRVYVFVFFNTAHSCVFKPVVGSARDFISSELKAASAVGSPRLHTSDAYTRRAVPTGRTELRRRSTGGSLQHSHRHTRPGTARTSKQHRHGHQPAGGQIGTVAGCPRDSVLSEICRQTTHCPQTMPPWEKAYLSIIQLGPECRRLKPRRRYPLAGIEHCR